jgi:GntR family transcriptional regulator
MTIDKRGAGATDRLSPMVFTLDPGSGVPTYLQLVQQVEQALRLGYLTPGDQLPKVREVVAELAINPNTVMKAYRDLEGKGLTAGRPGQGTFIVGTLDQVDLVGLTGLRKSLLAWMSDADESGLGQDGIVALFSSTLRDFADRRGQDGARDAGNVGRRSGGGVA